MPAPATASTTPSSFSWAAVLRIVFLIMLATALAPIGFGAQSVHAADRSVEWASIDIALDLQEDGNFAVTEQQTVDFTGGPFSNGFRDIPLGQVEAITKVRVGEFRDGVYVPYQRVSPFDYDSSIPDTYAISIRTGNAHIEWSFPRSYTETRVFVVQYVAEGALRVYDDPSNPFQEILWIPVGSALTEIAPVRRATFTITLPEAVDPADTMILSEDELPEDHTIDGKVWAWDHGSFSQGEQWRVGLQFPPIVSAVKPGWQDAADQREIETAQQEANRARNDFFALGIAGLLALLGAGGIAGGWYTLGRDPAVGFATDFLAEPPSDDPPGVAGALIDEVVDQKDVIATLVDLARRGALTIVETEDDLPAGYGGGKDYLITLVDPAIAGAPYETQMITAIFGVNAAAGASEKMSTLRKSYASTMADVERGIYDDLVARGYFNHPPDRTRSKYRSAAIGLLVAVVIMGCVGIGYLGDATSFGWLPVVVLVFVLAILAIISRAMPRKTFKGAEESTKWRGFKAYLESIESHQDLGAAPEIFERFLPYAVAFGIEKGWIRKFAEAQAPVPPWFGGPGTNPHPYGYPRGPVVIWGGGSGSGGGASVPTPDPGPVGGWGRGGSLQDRSDSLGQGLQGMSAGLFGLFDSASKSFTGAPIVVPSASGGWSGGWSSGGGGWSGGGGFSGGGGGFSGGGGGGGGGFN